MFSVVQVFYRKNNRIIFAAQKTGRTQPHAAGCPAWALHAAGDVGTVKQFYTYMMTVSFRIYIT